VSHLQHAITWDFHATKHQALLSATARLVKAVILFLDFLTTNMHIKLETNEPGPVISADIPLQATLAVDKKPAIVIRANEAQLTTLNDSFAKTALPNRAEMDEICKETGLYVFFWCSNYQDATRRGRKDYVL
jgi:hypothetical protein